MDYEFITITINNLTHGGITGDGNVRPSADRVKEIQSRVVFWAIVDGILLVTILSGNILTILAVRFSRKLRSIISNLFVLSLAISDMLVGFTLPYHLAFYLGSGLGNSHSWCLMRFFLIIIACCVSIWNLIAIAVDRYIAIVYPLHYSRYMTKKVALILISIGWLVGAAIASIPMFWNNWITATECEFDEILPPWYMAGIITPVFSLVWLCMLILYWRIWREASKHAKQLRSSFSGLHEGPSDWKSVQVVLLILGCFSICWLPYFIVACAQIFKFLEESSPTVYKAAFSLAMANSGMNPIIYAWKNSNFRRAFSCLLRCRSPDSYERKHQNNTNNGGGSGSGGHSNTTTKRKNSLIHEKQFDSLSPSSDQQISIENCTIIENKMITTKPTPSEPTTIEIKSTKLLLTTNSLDRNECKTKANQIIATTELSNDFNNIKIDKSTTTADVIATTSTAQHTPINNNLISNNNNNNNNNNNTKHVIINKLENYDNQHEENKQHQQHQQQHQQQQQNDNPTILSTNLNNNNCTIM